MSSESDIPVLYSFRRCPYAMRARLAIHYARCPVVLREVSLRSKPPELLRASAKGTVPVLVLPNKLVIDESLDIMHWALRQYDPDCWLPRDTADQVEVDALIAANDGPFKQALDRYKYADRYPAQSPDAYRTECEMTLRELERRLTKQAFLLNDRISLADAAIFPFVRQFVAVDSLWFERAPYPGVRQWLNEFLATPLFTQVMYKYPVWQPGDQPILFPSGSGKTLSEATNI